VGLGCRQALPDMVCCTAFIGLGSLSLPVVSASSTVWQRRPPFCDLRPFRIGWGGPRAANSAVPATPKSREQSQNVYENKGEEQKVTEMRGLVAQTGGSAMCGFSDWLGRAADRKHGGPCYTKIEGTKPECI